MLAKESGVRVDNARRKLRVLVGWNVLVTLKENSPCSSPFSCVTARRADLPTSRPNLEEDLFLPQFAKIVVVALLLLVSSSLSRSPRSLFLRSEFILLLLLQILGIIILVLPLESRQTPRERSQGPRLLAARLARSTPSIRSRKAQDADWGWVSPG